MAGARQLWLSGQCGCLSRSLPWSDSPPGSAHGHLPGCPQARFMNNMGPLSSLPGSHLFAFTQVPCPHFTEPVSANFSPLNFQNGL